MVTSAKSAVPTVADQAAAMQLGQCAKNLATCLAELRTATQKVSFYETVGDSSIHLTSHFHIWTLDKVCGICPGVAWRGVAWRGVAWCGVALSDMWPKSWTVMSFVFTHWNTEFNLIVFVSSTSVMADKAAKLSKNNWFCVDFSTTCIWTYCQNQWNSGKQSTGKQKTIWSCLDSTKDRNPQDCWFSSSSSVRTSTHLRSRFNFSRPLLFTNRVRQVTSKMLDITYY